MNRRELLLGASAVAVWPRGLVAEVLPGASIVGLEATFAPLRGALLAPAAWKPMPTFADRAAWSGLPEDVKAGLVTRADAQNNAQWPAMLATDELEYARNGNRSHAEGLSFGRRAKLGALVLGECVAGKGTYMDQIANGLWLICEETFWGIPAHVPLQHAGVGLADVSEPVIDLFAAETAAELAWIVYLLRTQLDAVSPMLVKRVQAEMERRIFVPYATRIDFWWMGLDSKHPRAMNNWNPWINSNVLAVTLLMDSGARRAEIVAKVCKSVDRYLMTYPKDGGCDEGPGYWSRSPASFFDTASLLISAHGGKGDAVLRQPLVRAMGQFICDSHIAGPNFVDYGDSHPHNAPEPEEAYRFGKASGNETLAEFGAFLLQEHPLSLAGTDRFARALSQVWSIAEMRSAPAHDALTRDAWYPELGLMTAREKEGEAKGFFVAMQAASNGRNHGHNDSGSVIVYLDGEPMFVDSGVGTYTAQTFSKDRYKIWTMQSEFHNLPIVGGVGEMQGNRYRATELVYAKGDARSSVAMQLATAYPATAGIASWKRTVALDRAAGCVEMDEMFSLKHAAPVTMVYLVAKEPMVSAGSVVVGKARLRFDAAVFEAKVEPVDLSGDTMVKSTWRDGLWRVMLVAKASVDAGSWKMVVERA